ncbi:D-alanyl-D-alanine carboxypeptidase (penicillin-binding protein 5/6) [Alkalibacterium putridalgicola]|uniref:serine-type D-Ala-D-Ala carboxypeptidase n=1 Tax=Alkalibacterium putridalgicola TaxID=426703 RepID=A0A1H7WNI6_9LACT|nr:serine hydrolase [Alkalibacterium putridalgicola]GEK90107.1 D-alanyl-D-alanine carboxypeptidase [Alkalibacterium putridalgicola]SEM22619.1 D-alanyl-D-alanine carboxypeptidase (penicillin-binding protein 5/6) [Alkalibacterium putridalgicola]
MIKTKMTRLLKLAMSASLAFPIFMTGTTAFADEHEIDIDADASLLVDFKTGQILHEQDADEAKGIASMTKMLVEYILFQEIEAGNLSWDAEVTISDYAYSISQDYALSNVPLHAGGTYTVKELYEALAIYSANGATIALAEEIEGAESAFVDRMRSLVESWGIEDYEIYNTTGLNNSYLNGNHYPGSDEDAENAMPAKGIAKVAMKLLEDYPEVLETSSIPVKTFREGTEDAISMRNWNWMLEGLAHERTGVDGLKTGTTAFAGATFTGTAETDGHRLVSVVMGAGDGFTNRSQRFEETAKLFDYGFGEWEYTTLVEGDVVLMDVTPLPVKNGLEEDVALKTTEALEYYLPDTRNKDAISYTFEPNEELLNQNGELEAPVEAGTILGELILDDQEGIDFLDSEAQNSIPVAAADSVERAGFFTVFSNLVKDFFGSLRDRF